MKDAVQDRASDLTACYHESLRKSWPGVAASLQCSLLQVPNNKETKPSTVARCSLLQCNKR